MSDYMREPEVKFRSGLGYQVLDTKGIELGAMPDMRTKMITIFRHLGFQDDMGVRVEAIFMDGHRERFRESFGKVFRDLFGGKPSLLGAGTLRSVGIELESIQPVYAPGEPAPGVVERFERADVV